MHSAQHQQVNDFKGHTACLSHAHCWQRIARVTRLSGQRCQAKLSRNGGCMQALVRVGDLALTGILLQNHDVGAANLFQRKALCKAQFIRLRCSQLDKSCCPCCPAVWADELCNEGEWPVQWLAASMLSGCMLEHPRHAAWQVVVYAHAQTQDTECAVVKEATGACLHMQTLLADCGGCESLGRDWCTQLVLIHVPAV